MSSKVKQLTVESFYRKRLCAVDPIWEEYYLKIAEKLVNITSNLSIPLIFKGSYKKANRTKLESFSGIGDIKALEILNKINIEFKIPVITDIHEKSEAKIASEYVDVLQIPAFLARQTELLVAAARTGKTGGPNRTSTVPR